MLNFWFRADTKYTSAFLITKNRHLCPLKGTWTQLHHCLVVELQRSENSLKKGSYKWIGRWEHGIEGIKGDLPKAPKLTLSVIKKPGLPRATEKMR